MLKRLKKARASNRAGAIPARGCGSIVLSGVSDVSPLEAIAGEYVMPDMESFEDEMMRKVEGLIAAGALDAGNGEALDARIDMELERVCARFERQHAENAVMLDRIEASLQARLREIEVREADVAQRLGGARDEAERVRAHEGAVKGARAAVSEAGAAASPTVVRIAPRIEDGAVQEMKGVSNG